MPLPQVTVGSSPGKQAMILACRSIIALGHRDQQEAQQLARDGGGQLTTWREDINSELVDYSIIRDNNVIWVNIHGTEDPLSITDTLFAAGYVLTSPFFPTGVGPIQVPVETGGIRQLIAYRSTLLPRFDHNVGAYVMGWVQDQGLPVLDAIKREIDRGLPERFVITGHSLGGAVAHYVSLVLTNALTPGDAPTLAERIVYSTAFTPFGMVGLGIENYRRQRQEFQQRLSGNTIPVDVLTFGEPRSVGPGSDYKARVHWRIVGTRTGQGSQPIDFVTLLPPNIFVAPGPGLLTGIPWARTVAVKVGLGVGPVHDGFPVYLTREGQVVQEPLSFIQRFSQEIGAGLFTALQSGVPSLHLLHTTYLPGSLSLPDQNGPVLVINQGDSTTPQYAGFGAGGPQMQSTPIGVVLDQAIERRRLREIQLLIGGNQMEIHVYSKTIMLYFLQFWFNSRHINSDVWNTVGRIIRQSNDYNFMIAELAQQGANQLTNSDRDLMIYIGQIAGRNYVEATNAAQRIGAREGPFELPTPGVNYAGGFDVAPRQSPPGVFAQNTTFGGQQFNLPLPFQQEEQPPTNSNDVMNDTRVVQPATEPSPPPVRIR